METGIRNLTDILTDFGSCNVLVVSQQKGTDWDECKNRVLNGVKIVRSLGHVTKVIFAVVGGATNGVPASVIATWVPSDITAIIDTSPGNTKEKTIAISKLVQKHKINHIIQSTSMYHSLRAYLTLRHTLDHDTGVTESIKIHNIVSDCTDKNNIFYAINDQLLLAKIIDPNLPYTSTLDNLMTCESFRSFSYMDMGFTKYFHNRLGEAHRLSLYGETGKGDLSTNLNPQDIISSYVINP